MALKDYPDWVLKHKKEKTEIRFLNNKYYLYSYKISDVNGKKKKVTDKYLGRITEEGLIQKTLKKTCYTVKEFSTAIYLINILKTVIIGAKKNHPTDYKNYIALASYDVIFNNDINLWNYSFLSTQLSLDELDIKRFKSMMNYFIEN